MQRQWRVPVSDEYIVSTHEFESEYAPLGTQTWWVGGQLRQVISKSLMVVTGSWCGGDDLQSSIPKYMRKNCLNEPHDGQGLLRTRTMRLIYTCSEVSSDLLRGPEQALS